jgi:hypothetical protein
MAIPVPVIRGDDDFAPLPLHEEEDVPEGSLHHRWCNYFYNVLRALFPHWFAAGNVCIYWEPGNTQKFVAPDAFLAQGAVPEPAPRSYRAWRLPPIIFAVEIGSLATAERGAKLDRYAERLRPQEVLYTEPFDEDKDEKLTAERVHLYRWSGAEYDDVPHAPDGQVWSEVLGAWIGVDEAHNPRVYDPQGAPLLNYEELEQALLLAEERAREEAHRRVMEAQAREEARQQAAAEARARQEAEQRAGEAEARLSEDTRARTAAEERARAAEARAQEAERRLAELLAQRDEDRP